ncbi:MAG: C40 family peptidase [Clostridia bacterium]|nr:C40 family peptidase [Clostridia bacterium]
MKKTKKLAALLLAATLILTPATMIACSANETSSTQTSQSSQNESIGQSSSSGNDSVLESPSQSESSAEEESSSTESSSSSSASSSASASSKPSVDSSSSSSSAEERVETTQYIRCTADSVNLRSGAGTNYAVIGSAEKNTRYVVLGKTGNWYKTYYKGKTAYVNASYAAVFSLEKSENANVEKVLAESYKLIGVPYVYGAVRLHDGNGNMLKGFTAQKFDCSSLVQYVFYKGAGKVLQVHTRSQILQGKKVKSGDLQRGDCMFFTNDSRKHLTGIERVGHVAIYLGDNYILHTASDFARIEQISTTRWNYFIEARRFV